MSTAEVNFAKQPLGVGQIVSDSFSIFARHLIKIMLVGFIPTMIGLVISGLVMGFGITLGTEQPDPSTVINGTFWAGFSVAMVAQLAIYSMTIALLVQLAFDAKVGNSHSIGEYFGPAIRAIVPIIVLGLIMYILVTLGFVLLIIPGLWLLAVFFVTVPAIVIDKAGFKGLGRSKQLTKEYRWPIVGTFIIMFISTILISIVTQFAMAALGGLIGGVAGIVFALILAGLLYAITYGLIGITIALVYARLRDIKEGVGVDKLAAVFD